MPEQSQSKIYPQIESLVKRDYLRFSHKRDSEGQYHSIANPNHAHNGIDSPKVGYNNLQGVKNFLVSNTITLNPTQIKALHTTPIVLIKNPGPRSFIYIDSIAARLTFGTIAYTGTNGLHFSYTNGTGLQVCGDIPASFINSASNAYAFVPAPTDVNRNLGFEFTPVGGDTGNNGQVVVSVPNANPSTGNSSITLVVYYRVVSFST